MKARYTVLGGTIIAEMRDSGRKEYFTDVTDSTVAIIDNSAEKIGSYRFWPYGEIRQGEGVAVPFLFQGAIGHYATPDNLIYGRRSYLDDKTARVISALTIRLGWSVTSYSLATLQTGLFQVTPKKRPAPCSPASCVKDGLVIARCKDACDRDKELTFGRDNICDPKWSEELYICDIQAAAETLKKCCEQDIDPKDPQAIAKCMKAFKKGLSSGGWCCIGVPHV